jgi:hypothetical protein
MEFIRDPFQEAAIKDDVDCILYGDKVDLCSIFQDPENLEDPAVLLLAGEVAGLFDDGLKRIVELWQDHEETLVVLRCYEEGSSVSCLSVKYDEVTMLSDGNRSLDGTEIEQARMFFRFTDWDADITAWVPSQYVLDD